MNMNKKIKLTVSLSEDEYYRAHSIIKDYLGISIHEFIRLTVRHAANLKELDTKISLSPGRSCLSSRFLKVMNQDPARTKPLIVRVGITLGVNKIEITRKFQIRIPDNRCSVLAEFSVNKWLSLQKEINE